MVTIWGRASSSNVQKTLWFCEELRIPHKRIDAGGPFGGLDEPTFRNLNPNGKVPVLVDGDFSIFESHAILRYLAGKTANSDELWPKDAKKRALCDQWMEWAHSALSSTMPILVIGLLRTPPEQRDQNKISAALEAANEAWAILDTHLASRPWLTGNTFTLGDIPVGVWAWRREQLPIEFKPFPKVEKWYHRLQERPAYKTVVMQPLS